MKPHLVIALVALVAIVGPGCISTEETVYRDVERTPVKFENETAGRIFYETLSQLPPQKASERRSEVHIPIVFKVSRTEKESGNTAFNEGVRRCDTDKDGCITETEARIFAENKGR